MHTALLGTGQSAIVVSDSFCYGITWIFITRTSSIHTLRPLPSARRYPHPSTLHTLIMSPMLAFEKAQVMLKNSELPQRTGSTILRSHRRRRLSLAGHLLPSAVAASVFVYFLVSVTAFSYKTGVISGKCTNLLARRATRTAASGPCHRILSLSLRKNPSRIAWATLFLNNGDHVGDAPDEEEWKAMLAAFQMYNAAYGNLKVPLRFVVPSLAPWPGKIAVFVVPPTTCRCICFYLFLLQRSFAKKSV